MNSINTPAIRAAALTLGALLCAGVIAWALEMATDDSLERAYALRDHSESFEDDGSCAPALESIVRTAIEDRATLKLGSFDADARARRWLFTRDYAATFEGVEVKDAPDRERRERAKALAALERADLIAGASGSRLLEALERVAKEIEREDVDGSRVSIRACGDVQVIDEQVDVRRGRPSEPARELWAKRLEGLEGAQVAFEGAGLDLAREELEVAEEFLDDVLEHRVGARITEFDAGSEQR